MLLADEFEDRRAEVGVAHYSAALDFTTIDDHSLDSRAADQDFGDIASNAGVDAVAMQFRLHLPDEIVGSPLIDKDPFGHEVGEDDAIGDGGIFERGAVGVGDRFHEQANDIFTTGEKLLEQLARGQRLVIVKIHPSRGVEEAGHRYARDTELAREEFGEVLSVVGGGQREHRVVESYPLELDDIGSDFLVPVPLAAFEHSVGEAVERNVERMAPGAFEPSRKSAEFVVLLKKENAVTGAAQDVCRGHSCQPASDDDHVVLGEDPG